MKTFPFLNQRLSLLPGILLGARPAIAAPLFQLAQIPSNLRTGLQGGLGVLFLIGFIVGVIVIWSGALKLKNGDSEGKMGIVAGIIIAAAAAIMEALFAIFGMSDGALTPTF